MDSKGTVLITGGARRVGRVIALVMAGAGYNIALNYNSSKKDAEELKTEINELGNTECEIFQADISNIEECKKLFKEVTKKFTDLNVLINNASIFERCRFEDTDEKFLDDNFAVHLKAPFFLSQEFARFAKKGNIINITDTNTRKNSVEFFAYMLSKKSLNDLTLMLAKILAPKVRVNAIAPGTILPSIEMTEEEINNKINKLPKKSLVSPEEVAKTIIQLIENEVITGQVLYLDGGEHLL